jgi:hypothetical protein
LKEAQASALANAERVGILANEKAGLERQVQLLDERAQTWEDRYNKASAARDAVQVCAVVARVEHSGFGNGCDPWLKFWLGAKAHWHSGCSMLQSEAGELRARLAATAGAEEAKSALTQQLEADLAAALQRLDDTEAARRQAEGEAQTLREEAGEARASRDQRVAALEEHVLELEAQVCFWCHGVFDC